MGGTQISHLLFLSSHSFVLFVYLVLIEQMQGKFLSELFSISILPTLPKTLEVFLNYKAKKYNRKTMLVFFFFLINFKKPTS